MLVGAIMGSPPGLTFDDEDFRLAQGFASIAEEGLVAKVPVLEANVVALAFLIGSSSAAVIAEQTREMFVANAVMMFDYYRTAKDNP